MRWKRQPSEWEKIIANKATDKELISKRYKAIEKRAGEDMDRWSRGPREYAQTSQMIRERQIKITVRY